MANVLTNIGRVPELKNRILFSLAMLAIYRVGVFVTVPGVDQRVLAEYFQAGAAGGLLGLIDLFSGGALQQISIFALGIMPYISSSIILQLLTVIVPTVERLNKEGEAGRRKINQWTRYGTILLSLVQGLMLAKFLEGITSQTYGGAVDVGGWGFRALCVLSLTTGTVFIMWLGEQITERGIGNGISLIIYAGIVAGLPSAVRQTLELVSNGQIPLPILLGIGALIVAVIAVIVYFESAQRRIPVQYAKRVVGRQIFQGSTSHLPLKVNTAGVIPPIFASSVLMAPATLANFLPEQQWLVDIVNRLSPGHLLYNTLYVAMIVFFCYFYTAVTFNPMEVADNLKKGGGFVPGVRAGKKTAEYIDKVLSRITFGGAVYISAVCVLPAFLQTSFNVPFFFGGTSLLIVVGVAMDTSRQIESHLINRSYEGFGGGDGPRVRGRRTDMDL